MNDSEVPAVGKQVIVACAFIHHNFDGVEKIFMPKRAATKKFMSSVFELPGGHVGFGEDIVAGLKREIREEFGKTITVGDPFAAFTYHNSVKGSHSIEVVYFAQFDDIGNIQLNPKDHSEYKWLSFDELPKVFGNGKDETDEEIQLIKRGFTLLDGA
ncbi:NUDIX hydrolase [Candidatus Saccharibacteria bacterium]|nr:NUDIX hydrolase [Candidatus Saccharibacteria bacterium]